MCEAVNGWKALCLQDKRNVRVLPEETVQKGCGQSHLLKIIDRGGEEFKDHANVTEVIKGVLDMYASPSKENSFVSLSPITCKTPENAFATP